MGSECYKGNLIQLCDFQEIEHVFNAVMSSTCYSIICISAVIVALSFLEQGNCNGLGQGKQRHYGGFAAECKVSLV